MVHVGLELQLKLWVMLQIMAEEKTRGLWKAIGNLKPDMRM